MKTLFLPFVLMIACGAEPTTLVPGDPDFVRDPSLDVTLVSASGGTSSHEAGASCQHCHQALGPGPGQFSVAGTLYTDEGTPASEGTIQILSVQDGAELARLDVDANGNFYTTMLLGLPDAAILPVVLDAGGETVHSMPFPTTSGACNHCHTPARRVALSHDHGGDTGGAGAGH